MFFPGGRIADSEQGPLNDAPLPFGTCFPENIRRPSQFNTVLSSLAEDYFFIILCSPSPGASRIVLRPNQDRR